jgi:hypothetical protein
MITCNETSPPEAEILEIMEIMSYSHVEARQIFEIHNNPDSFGFPGFAPTRRERQKGEKRFIRFMDFAKRETPSIVSNHY